LAQYRRHYTLWHAALAAQVPVDCWPSTATRILEEQQQQLITGYNEQSTKSGNTQQQQESERENIIQRKRKRGGEWDHPERSNVRKINDNEDKVRKILFTHQSSMDELITMPMMTEPCRTFFKQVAMPIQKCLQNHFNNNMPAFLQKHTKNGKFPHSKFSKICAGNGSSCVQ
jgi:hypothetical protein